MTDNSDGEFWVILGGKKPAIHRKWRVSTDKKATFLADPHIQAIHFKRKRGPAISTCYPVQVKDRGQQRSRTSTADRPY